MDIEMEENLEINDLIVRFLCDKATQGEIVVLNNWVKLSEDNKKLFQQIKNYFEASQKPNFSIDTNKALQKTNTKINKHNKINIWFAMQRVAAILFIPLLALGGYMYFTSNKEQPINYHEIRANIGSCLSLNLPDGTKVWLNSGSKLRYPDKFAGNNRNVFLDGEAYFEVQSSVKNKFIVTTANIQTVATGTEFVISDFSDSDVKEIALVEGEVTVNMVQEPDKKIAILKPNQNISYNINNHAVEIFEGDIYKYYAWKDDKLIFRNDSMAEVLKKISQRYNVNIELRDKELQEYSYWASFKSETFDEVLELLKISAPIDYFRVPRIQLKDGSFTEPKVIIYKR